MTKKLGNIFRLSLILATAMILLVLIPGRSNAGQAVEEYHIKAVFLFNLTHFVYWPPGLRDSTAPFVIGIYGPDPFGNALDEAIAGEKKDNRPLMIRHYTSLSQLTTLSCDILYISSAAMSDWRLIRRRLDHAAVLTVSDTAGFPEQGGMVNLLKKQNRIQIQINRDATREAGLTVSSKLLSLAHIVK